MTTPLSCSAALIYEMQPHHLDHLAPLAIELSIPLILTKRELFSLAKTYYPRAKVHLFSPLSLSKQVFSRWDILFSSLPRPLFDQIFFLDQQLSRKHLFSIWCPHGNSDKGHLSFWMEGLSEDRAALLYGQKMADFLEQKNSFSQLKMAPFIGNYRSHFYQKHQHFYDKLVKKKILSHFPKKAPLIFYAPTWKDGEKSTSFFSAFPHLIHHFPSHWNLLIQMHPNLLVQESLQVEILLEKAQSRSNIFLSSFFPPIYPLLQVADLYLGDFSSIGYDCLFFKKPMIFLNELDKDPSTHPSLSLFSCGTVVNKKEYPDIISIIAKELQRDQTPFQKKRDNLYHYTFQQTEPSSLLSIVKNALDELQK